MLTDADDADVLLDDLESHIDSVETALRPLLKQTLSITTSKLPLLDKAKLYVHTAYAIESLIFSSLKLSDVDAKSHPVFKELARVKAYFGKLKAAEETGPQVRLDRSAANRFIKSALSGNDEHDRKRAEGRQQRGSGGEKGAASALEERYSTSARFANASKRMEEAEKDGKDTDAEGVDVQGASQGSSMADRPPDAGDSPRGGQTKKKRKSGDADGNGLAHGNHHPAGRSKKKKLSKAPKDAHQAYQSLLDKAKRQQDV